MAERLHSLSGFAHASEFDVLSSAAAELRKTCATCRFFGSRVEYSSRDNTPCCKRFMFPLHIVAVPSDGSGFCHRWEPKS